MPVKRMRKQSKKHGGNKKHGGASMYEWFTGKKEEVSKEEPQVVPVVESNSSKELKPVADTDIGVAPKSDASASVQESNASAPVQESNAPAAAQESNAPAVELRKPEPVVSEQSVVAPQPKSRWWPFSGGKSRRRRSAKGAKGAKRSAKGTKRSAKGGKRCSKKNCKSRKHKH